jgi:plasmid stabilization system protein ParE
MDDTHRYRLETLSLQALFEQPSIARDVERKIAKAVLDSDSELPRLGEGRKGIETDNAPGKREESRQAHCKNPRERLLNCSPP